MTLTRIALRHLARRRGRAAFILAGLVIGAATAVGVVSYVEAVAHDIAHKLEQYGANILIVPRTENLSLSYGGLELGGVSFELQEIRESDLGRLADIRYSRNIAAVGPMALGVVEAGGRRLLMAGVDFEAAAVLKPWWRVAGRFPEAEEVLLGAEAARLLGLAVGGRLEANGVGLAVSGLLEPTGSQDDQLAFVRLPTAQALLGKPGRVSMAEVAALCKECPIEEMVAQISAALPGARVMAIQQVVASRLEMLAAFRRFSYGLSAVILLIAALLALVTMMGSVRERTGEIGIFRAVGFRRGHIMRVVFLEAGIVAAAAGAIGYAVGFAGARIALGLSAESHGGHLPFSPELASGAVALSLALGLLAAIYPALVAARLDPNDALRAL